LSRDRHVWLSGTTRVSTVRPVRTGRLALVVVGLCVCAGCSSGAPSTVASTGPNPVPDVSTRVISVSATSQLSQMVKWDLANKSDEAQLVTCEVLVLNGTTQLGQYGPEPLAVAGGATAEEFSEVSTLAGSTPGDTAQIACQKG
jgi:hypothetical protein